MKKGFAPVLIILLFIAFAALGAIAYLKFFYLNTPFMKYETKMQDGTLTLPSDPTANWKTYTDAKNKFSFRYPGNWDKLLVMQDGQNLLVVAPTENISKVSGSLANENPNTTIIIMKTDQKPNYATEIGWSVRDEKQIVLSGKPATRFTRIYTSDIKRDFTIGAKTEWVVVRDGNSYVIIGLEDYQYLDTFNRILSTLKFTN